MSVSKMQLAAADYTTVVQQLYVAYFGRPADSTGLANFAAMLSNAGAPTDIQNLNAAYSSNATVKWLIDAFGTSEESKALYSGDTRSFVTAIYNNMLGRAPDEKGLDFWVNAIDKGGLTRGNASLSIMAGALANSTPEGLVDAALIKKRIAVAETFTSSITPSYSTAYVGNAAAASARDMLKSVSGSTDVSAFSTNINSTLGELASSVTTASGYAMKAPLNGANVTIYALNADGSRGSILGTGTTATDNTGKFSVTFQSKGTTSIAIAVSNGTYTSRYDGKAVQATSTMEAIVDSVSVEGVSGVSVTPLSDMVVQRCATLMKQGSTLSSALATARTNVQSLYQLSASPESIVPSFSASSAGTDAFALGLILASLESFTQTVGATDGDAVYATISSDFSDGKLDGKSASTALQYGTLANATADILKDKMFTDIRGSVVATVNRIAPASLISWTSVNPATASSKGVASPPPGYSCSSGYTLVTDSAGSTTCWDGTTSSSGAPIIGAYTVCNGVTTAGTTSCSPMPTYSCPSGYQLVNDPSGNATCWDGTRTSAGDIYLGGYYICGADNSKVISASQCKPSSTINLYTTSTTPAIFTAATPAQYKNSTQIAIYTAPAIDTFQAAPVVALSASDVAAISATVPSVSLPSWSSLGTLNSAQLDAINRQTSLLTSFWAYH